MFLHYLFTMVEVFDQTLDQQSCLVLQTAGGDIHVHQLVAHKYVVVQLTYALLMIT